MGERVEHTALHAWVASAMAFAILEPCSISVCLYLHYMYVGSEGIIDASGCCVPCFGNKQYKLASFFSQVATLRSCFALAGQGGRQVAFSIVLGCSCIHGAYFGHSS